MKKRILPICIIITLLTLFSACDAGDKVNLTYEQAKYISGFISVGESSFVGLCDDGTVKGFNGAMPTVSEGREIFERFGEKLADISKISYSSYGDECACLFKDGKLITDHQADEGEGVYENCEDFIYAPSGPRDYLTILYNNGTVYSDTYTFDDELSSVVQIGSDTGSLICCTLSDGTVVIGASENAGRAKTITLETDKWTDIEMATAFYDGHDEEYGGYQAVGLKKDGTVIATGRFAEMVKSWENVVYLGTGYTHDSGCVVALTSNGRLLAAGDNLDALNYTDRNSGKTTNPLNFKNIIAFDIDLNNLITLNADGKLVGEYASGDGIGPKDYSL